MHRARAEWPKAPTRQRREPDWLALACLARCRCRCAPARWVVVDEWGRLARKDLVEQGDAGIVEALRDVARECALAWRCPGRRLRQQRIATSDEEAIEGSSYVRMPKYLLGPEGDER